MSGENLEKLTNSFYLTRERTTAVGYEIFQLREKSSVCMFARKTRHDAQRFQPPQELYFLVSVAKKGEEPRKPELISIFWLQNYRHPDTFHKKKIHIYSSRITSKTHRKSFISLLLSLSRSVCFNSLCVNCSILKKVRHNSCRLQNFFETTLLRMRKLIAQREWIMSSQTAITDSNCSCCQMSHLKPPNVEW